MTYVDIDDDTDSLDVTVDTPPHSMSHKMPHVEMVKPAETPEDVQTPKEEERIGTIVACMHNTQR